MFITGGLSGIGGESNKAGNMTEEAWFKVIGINLNGVFNGMKQITKNFNDGKIS